MDLKFYEGIRLMFLDTDKDSTGPDYDGELTTNRWCVTINKQ